jgi:hypothetical protein
MKVFLDDVRIPMDCIPYMYKRIGNLNPIYLEKWEIVRSYEEFVKFVSENYMNITHISFDHDLADEHYNPAMYDSAEEYSKLEFKEKTGYDCAIWLKNYYAEKSISLPIMFVHSMNPVGTENIINVFK